MHYVFKGFCAQLFMVGLLCCTLPYCMQIHAHRAHTHTHARTHTHTLSAVLCKKLSSGFLILMLLVSQCVCGFLSDSFYSFLPALSKYTDSIMHTKNEDSSFKDNSYRPFTPINYNYNEKYRVWEIILNLKVSLSSKHNYENNTNKLYKWIHFQNYIFLFHWQPIRIHPSLKLQSVNFASLSPSLLKTWYCSQVWNYLYYVGCSLARLQRGWL